MVENRKASKTRDEQRGGERGERRNLKYRVWGLVRTSSRIRSLRNDNSHNSPLSTVITAHRILSPKVGFRFPVGLPSRSRT